MNKSRDIAYRLSLNDHHAYIAENHWRDNSINPCRVADMNQDELAQVIAQARDDGSTTLDLSNQRLESLPPEIGNLTAMGYVTLERMGYARQ